MTDPDPQAKEIYDRFMLATTELSRLQRLTKEAETEFQLALQQFVAFHNDDQGALLMLKIFGAHKKQNG